MTSISIIVLVVLISVLLENNLVNTFVQLDTNNPAFDPSFYEERLDAELCAKQLEIIKNDVLLRFEFVESGPRIPRGILTGSIVDFGNYHQCLGIMQEANDTVIEGKYCTINVPANQELPEWPTLPEWPEGIEWPDWITRPWNEFNPSNLRLMNETMKSLQLFNAMNSGAHTSIGLQTNGNNLRSAITDALNIQFVLAVCVPKVCTTQEGIDGLLFDTTALGFKYEDRTCRLKNDKPWVPADYVAIVLFSIIGIIAALSTSYDLYFTYILKNDPKTLSVLGRSFSVYTNTRRLTTFVSNPGTLECLDGIRALAMTWVIVGHTFYTLPFIMNNLDALDWQTSFRSMWITSAPITVDTFFMLSGLLLVYTTTGKLTGMRLLRTLHTFYLNRFLRMFPLLGAAVLAQASIYHRLTDGPAWETVATHTNNCRSYWWATMLYIQNYVISPQNLCLGHSWYLAIDMQLHILSPIVLFWVLSKKRNVPWMALSAAMLICLAASTTYNFIMELPGGAIVPARVHESLDYLTYYYVNTLTRASPFFVGMIFGYLLHVWRGKKFHMSKRLVFLLWVCALISTSIAVYITEPMKDVNWDNQIVDSLANSFMRPLWATGLGWIIFACVHGYGGPVNWFLSLRLWKLPSRISYAMYLFHFPTMYMMYGTRLAPIYFSVMTCLYNFMSQITISLIVGFVMTLLFDSSFSILFKLALGGGPRKPKKPVASEDKKPETEVYKL